MKCSWPECGREAMLRIGLAPIADGVTAVAVEDAPLCAQHSVSLVRRAVRALNCCPACGWTECDHPERHVLRRFEGCVPTSVRDHLRALTATDRQEEE